MVERRTVECVKTSLGRWFESGSKEIFDHVDLTPKEASRLIYLSLNYERTLVMVSLSGTDIAFGTPSIAQLVERRTVECVKTSLGRWFESGSKEIFDHVDLNPNEALRLKFSL